MVISCKMAQCPYHDNQGFCAKPTVVTIDQLGMCQVLWRKGEQRQLVGPFEQKRKITIVEGKRVIDREEAAGAALQGSDSDVPAMV